MTLAQDSSHSSTYPTVQVPERTFLTMLEITKPSTQNTIHLNNDLFQAFAIGPSCLLANGFFELFQAFPARPFHASLKMVAQKVKASLLTHIHDPRFGRMKHQSRARHPLLNLCKDLSGFFLAGAEHDEV